MTSLVSRQLLLSGSNNCRFVKPDEIRIIYPMYFLDHIAEAAIVAARDRGELDNLPGAGKQLVLDDDSSIPHELRAAYRILKNSGHLPPAVVRLKKIAELETEMVELDCDQKKIELLTRLSLLRSQL